MSHNQPISTIEAQYVAQAVGKYGLFKDNVYEKVKM